MINKEFERLKKEAFDSGQYNDYVDQTICDEAGNYLYDLEQENPELKLTEDEEEVIKTEFIDGVISGYKLETKSN